uniref:Enoyl reductase (ER) domain-containing protein n=1 Tax=Phytophthora ramorum TaxID=164328 RepID=H3H8Q4_PHYRM
MASTNLVYRISDRTSHHNLKAQIEPLPTVQDHEVLVEIRGVTLNARDLQICSGLYPAAAVKDDLVPCSDGAGVIAAVGPAVDDIHVGDRVIINIALDNLYGPLKSQDHMLGGGVDGTLRQYAAVPALAITKVPEECKLDYVQLASLVCTGATVWNSLYGYVPMKPGQAVLFQGTGGVSITGVQLAKAAGAVTIVTSSSDEKLKFGRRNS